MREEIEKPYFDKNGKEIKEFALLKIFHFKGLNNLGRGRKNYFMYKWIKIIDGKFVALHLTNGSGDYFHLSTVYKNHICHDAEIVQSY